VNAAAARTARSLEENDDDVRALTVLVLPLLLLAATVALSGAPLASGATNSTVLYQDGFNDETLSSDWNTRSGSWTERSGALLEASSSSGILVNDAAPGGGNLRASVDVEAGTLADNYASLLLRGDAAGENGVEVRLDWTDGEIGTLKVGWLQGGTFHVQYQVEMTKTPIVGQTVYRLDAQVVNDTVTLTATNVTTNGPTQLSVTHPSLETGHTYVGLKGSNTGSSTSLFDNFRIDPILPNEIVVSGNARGLKKGLQDVDVTLLQPEGTVVNRLKRAPGFSFRAKKGWKLNLNASEEKDPRAVVVDNRSRREHREVQGWRALWKDVETG